MFPEPARLQAADLHVGLSRTFEREVTEADVLAFACLSQDYNPLHVDARYAGRSVYGCRIVHGAFQIACASAMIGMHLPGLRVLLGSVNARFLTPLHFPARVRVTGQLTAWNAARRAGQVKVIVQDLGSGSPVSEIFMGVSFQEPLRAEPDRPAPAQGPEGRAAQGPELVLLTGAAGGLGQVLARALAVHYSVLAMTRSPALPETLAGIERLIRWTADLDDPGLPAQLERVLGGRKLFAIVHAAWPSMPHGGLLTGQDEVIQSQLSAGSLQAIRLARLLFANVSDAGGRFIALGSVAGSRRPQVNRSAYSLGKATLEHVIRLLAPELARKRITANVIAPSFVPVGFNRQSTEAQRAKEAALTPLGRVCQPEDVQGLVAYLLSEAAGFVSGQVIPVTGAQL